MKKPLSLNYWGLRSVWCRKKVPKKFFKQRPNSTCASFRNTRNSSIIHERPRTNDSSSYRRLFIFELVYVWKIRWPWFICWLCNLTNYRSNFGGILIAARIWLWPIIVEPTNFSVIISLSISIINWLKKLLFCCLPLQVEVMIGTKAQYGRLEIIDRHTDKTKLFLYRML